MTEIKRYEDLDRLFEKGNSNDSPHYLFQKMELSDSLPTIYIDFPMPQATWLKIYLARIYPTEDIIYESVIVEQEWRLDMDSINDLIVLLDDNLSLTAELYGTFVHEFANRVNSTRHIKDPESYASVTNFDAFREQIHAIRQEMEMLSNKNVTAAK